MEVNAECELVGHALMTTLVSHTSPDTRAAQRVSSSVKTMLLYMGVRAAERSEVK